MKKSMVTLGLLASFSAFAAENMHVEILDPYVRLAPENAQNSAAFLRLKNNSDVPIVLVEANNPASKVTELQEHKHEDGVMKMVKIDSIDLIPQQETELKPGSLHIMLIGLKEPLKEGQSIDFTLKFKDETTKTFSAVVKKQ